VRNCKILFLVLVIAGLGTSCERRNSVVIKQGNPQQFIISAHGLLDWFSISGGATPDRWADYWVIAPLDPNFESARLTEPIVYGQVPVGFRQVAPLNNQQPPPITEGFRGSVALEIRNGQVVHMLFVVQNGKITTEADAD
jgi:hypothetical protein